MMSDGLKQIQTYEEVFGYIANDKDKIKLPNRTAKQLRNAFELSQLDGIGTHIMEQQQLREAKEREKEHFIRQVANDTDQSANQVRASQPITPVFQTPPYASQETSLIASPYMSQGTSPNIT